MKLLLILLLAKILLFMVGLDGTPTLGFVGSITLEFIMNAWVCKARSPMVRYLKQLVALQM